MPKGNQQDRERISALLATEVQAYQKKGLPNEIIGLKIYTALIDARLEIEQLKAAARTLADQLGKEIEDIARFKA